MGLISRVSSRTYRSCKISNQCYLKLGKMVSFVTSEQFAQVANNTQTSLMGKLTNNGGSWQVVDITLSGGDSEIFQAGNNQFVNAFVLKTGNNSANVESMGIVNPHCDMDSFNLAKASEHVAAL